MYRKWVPVVVVACLLSLVTAGVGGAAGFPEKPVTILVPHAAGGGTDAIARSLGKAAEAALGRPVTVVNKVGAGGAVGMTEGLHSPADGYTVTFATVEICLHPTMGNVQWTPADFKPVMRVNFDASAVTVKSDSPYKTFEDFIKAAKDNPGKLKVGGSAPGTIWHLAALGLQRTAGIRTNVIPFPGGAAPAITDLLGGHLDAITVSAAEGSTAPSFTQPPPPVGQYGYCSRGRKWLMTGSTVYGRTGLPPLYDVQNCQNPGSRSRRN
jgi:tripartite-type tricarboxylate transporter receptor subunit TctC